MNLTTVSRCKSLLPSLLMSLLLTCAGAHLAIGQQVQTQSTSAAHPVPLTQLYWSFLSYQQHLDNLAAQKEEQRENGDWLRNALQKQLQFSDSDFAQIRNSGRQLVQQVTALDAQAAAIRAEGMLPPSRTQLTELTLERQSEINGTMQNLAQALSPGKKAAMDAFLPRFFHVTVAPSAATPSTEVHQ
jgi:hypothetical protein